MATSISHSQLIESLCSQGCDSVRNTITALEKGEYSKQMSGLSPEEQHEILKELKEIMAVYDKPRSR